MIGDRLGKQLREAAAVPAGGHRRSRATNAWHWRFMLPTLVVLGLTTIIPLAYTLYLSLMRTQPGQIQPIQFAGINNYTRLFASPTFWHSLLIEGVFVILALTIELVAGFWIALLVNQSVPGVGIVRTLLLFPIVLPPVVTALLYDYMLQSQVGVISYYLGVLGIQQTWLDQQAPALLVLVFIDVWQFTPFVILLVLAGLQSLPVDVMEAARIDGATAVQIVLRIVLPLLRPVMLTILVLRFIDAVQVFPTIYVLTQGGPGDATNALNYLGFTEFFQHLDVAYGATIAVVVTVLALVVAVGMAMGGRLQLGERGGAA